MEQKTVEGCSVLYCQNVAVAGGLCKKHNSQKIAGKDPNYKAPCTIEGCGNVEYSGGLCTGHYRRARRGSVVEGPLQAREGNLAQLPPVTVPFEVMDMLEAVAAKQGISKFLFLRRIVLDWYKRTTGVEVD